jgi:hypothetical protein
VVDDGIRVLDFLHRRGNHADAVRRDLIPLDLNLRKKNGREQLAEAESDPAPRNIPLVPTSRNSSKRSIGFESSGWRL